MFTPTTCRPVPRPSVNVTIATTRNFDWQGGSTVSRTAAASPSQLSSPCWSLSPRSCRRRRRLRCHTAPSAATPAAPARTLRVAGLGIIDTTVRGPTDDALRDAHVTKELAVSAPRRAPPRQAAASPNFPDMAGFLICHPRSPPSRSGRNANSINSERGGQIAIVIAIALIDTTDLGVPPLAEREPERASPVDVADDAAVER